MRQACKLEPSEAIRAASCYLSQLATTVSLVTWLSAIGTGTSAPATDTCSVPSSPDVSVPQVIPVPVVTEIRDECAAGAGAHHRATRPGEKQRDARHDGPARVAEQPGGRARRATPTRWPAR
jgi:hypothetical protein